MRVGFPLLFACVVAASATGLAAATDGFRVVTSEGARRLEAVRQPQAVPPFSLTDQDGRQFSLADYRGKTLLVDFVYTRCPTICEILGEEFQQLQTLIRREDKTSRIALLSISFDTAHDGPSELKSYGERFAAAAPGWRIAVPPDRELRGLLRSFGVVVIPDRIGGFIHNDAISVVAPDGRLVRILDPAPARQLLAQIAGTARQ